MKKIEVELTKHNLLEVQDTLTFLGSCFSEHMADSTIDLAFNVISNPFGVIFNPISLAEQLNSNEEEWRSSIFQSDDKFLSWNASSIIWGLDIGSVESELSNQRQRLFDHIRKSSVLFITFGSAWVYELKKEDKIVANCHKQSRQIFNKRCLTAKEIVAKWKLTLENVKRLNPELKVVFTVSPVRHKKDGLVENTLSKAHLISAVHEIIVSQESCFYFPSYEIVIDELRDYSYFEKDGVHPNKYAIEEVEDRFLKSMLSYDAQSVIQDFLKIKSQKDGALYDTTMDNEFMKTNDSDGIGRRKID
jgi:hypothetical protein